MPHVAPNFLVTVLVFGLSVLDVLNDSTISKIDRDLDVVDLFCGRAAIHRAAASQGLTSVSFDKSRIPGTTDSGLADETEDMSTLEGFMRALRLVLRLRRGGLLVMGPPCSSFVMLNTVNCKRNSANNYRGDEGYQPVQLGNLLATATAFLMTLAAVRHVEVVVENPPGSTIWKFPQLKRVLDVFVQRSVVTPRCAWSREAFGQRMLKYFKFFATGAWITSIYRKCLCPGRKHFKLTWAKWNRGRLTFTGKRLALRQSAAYPDALGQAIICAWRNHRPSAVNISIPSTSSLASSSGLWLQPSPGSSSSSVGPPLRKSQRVHPRVQRSKQPTQPTCCSAMSWLEPCPGASTLCITSSWLTPSPGESGFPTDLQDADPSTPAWLNPCPGSA